MDVKIDFSICIIFLLKCVPYLSNDSRMHIQGSDKSFLRQIKVELIIVFFVHV